MPGGGVRVSVRRRSRNTIGFRCPGSKINLFAALRAEGAPTVGRFPYNAFTALRALYGFLDGVHRLQKVSSKGTSCSTVLGRVTVSGRMKRMLSAYLLALISGTAASEADMRTRSICAVRPLMVS